MDHSEIDSVTREVNYNQYVKFRTKIIIEMYETLCYSCIYKEACAVNKRHTKIIELVSQYGKVEVNELSNILETSRVTIRKDLDHLADKGILQRERGYAILKRPDDINYRMAFHYEAKQKIARAAANLVEEGETIIVESGSTCALFVEQLLLIKRKVTIITNSAYIANCANDKSGIDIILLGGNYQRHTQAVVGPMVKECIRNFHVDKIFIGIDGFDKEIGFTGLDLIRADTVKNMAAQANHIYILTESGKFRNGGVNSFLKTEDVYEVITDPEISPEIRNYLLLKGVKVLAV